MADKLVLKLSAVREAHRLEDLIDKTMTVGDLIDFLSEYDEDTRVIISNDGGYTFGRINEEYFEDLEYTYLD